MLLLFPLLQSKGSSALFAFALIDSISYHLCGKVDILQPPPGVSPSKQRMVLIKSEKGETIGSKMTDASGNYCFEVTPGVYVVEPQIDATEQSAGLHLTISQSKVTVTSAPVL